MGKNYRFSVSVHILALLAIEDKALSSDYLAGSVRTNPVVIRRLVSILNKAGLVTTQTGTGGGTSLAHNPEDISLWMVYRTLGEEVMPGMSEKSPNPYCVCARNIQPVLEGVFSKVEQAVEQTLKQMTIAQIAREIVAHDTHITEEAE